MNKKDFLIKSPDGAVYVVEQSLFLAEDRDAAVLATVHRVECGAAGNVWERFGPDASNESLGYKRLLDERLENQAPSVYMLNGEVMRFASSGILNMSDMRDKLTLQGLFVSAASLVK